VLRTCIAKHAGKLEKFRVERLLWISRDEADVARDRGDAECVRKIRDLARPCDAFRAIRKRGEADRLVYPLQVGVIFTGIRTNRAGDSNTRCCESDLPVIEHLVTIDGGRHAQLTCAQAKRLQLLQCCLRTLFGPKDQPDLH